MSAEKFDVVDSLQLGHTAWWLLLSPDKMSLARPNGLMAWTASPCCPAFARPPQLRLCNLGVQLSMRAPRAAVDPSRVEHTREPRDNVQNSASGRPLAPSFSPRLTAQAHVAPCHTHSPRLRHKSMHREQDRCVRSRSRTPELATISVGAVCASFSARFFNAHVAVSPTSGCITSRVIGATRQCAFSTFPVMSCVRSSQEVPVPIPPALKLAVSCSCAAFWWTFAVHCSPQPPQRSLIVIFQTWSLSRNAQRREKLLEMDRRRRRLQFSSYKDLHSFRIAAARPPPRDTTKPDSHASHV